MKPKPQWLIDQQNAFLKEAAKRESGVWQSLSPADKRKAYAALKRQMIGGGQ